MVVEVRNIGRLFGHTGYFHQTERNASIRSRLQHGVGGATIAPRLGVAVAIGKISSRRE
jgi:hypothetical protein